MSELVVDNFAGGGGASTGIEAGLGRSVDFAINHDALAIAMHRANHPETMHLHTSVWEVNPQQLAAGRPVGLGWFSPDCTFHSKARGGKPFRDRNTARRRRGLAWLIPYWMKSVRPRVVMLENVEEFADWGPLLPDGQICPQRRGMTFRRWHRQIENLGYQVDMRELRACDYGAPTIRKRLFVIARCDGEEIVFPEAMHGPGLLPYRTAAECIDWSLPCPSIFERKRPLAENTMRRIARGVMRYVVNSGDPFIVPIEHYGGQPRADSIHEPIRTIVGSTTGSTMALVAPTLINTRNGERLGQAPRVRNVLEPYATVNAAGSQGGLVAAFLARHYGGHENDGAPMTAPMHTVTTKDHHALVTAFLLKFYGTDQDPRLTEPMHTLTTKHRMALVTVAGQDYRIVDIGMRMLSPRELFRAQGFTDAYQIEHGIDENDASIRLTKTAQVQMCGNSVCPPLAEALVRANIQSNETNQRSAAA